MRTNEVRSFTGLFSKGYGSAPPPQPSEHPPWWAEVLPSKPLPPRRRIFCNRALNMKGIKAMGFDMDYTLAQYKPETFEALAHKATIDKLVRNFNYPESLRELKFSWDYMVKGLIIDKNRGNTLKVDRHRYVKIAYHGFDRLADESRKSLYNCYDYSFDEPDYAMVDTLFSLAEAYLFMQLVELKDRGELGAISSKSYSELYSDLRTAVDLCHRDGSLKKAVAADPPHFIHLDPLLPQVLLSLRASGRKVFLATNSLWDFTHVVMNYLLLGKSGAQKSFEWLSYFDVVMVGCGKPGFFQPRGQLFSVDTKTGYLLNTDNGAPTLPLEETGVPNHTSPPSSSSRPPPLTSPSSSTSTTTVASSGGGSVSETNDSSVSGQGPPLAEVFQGGCYRDLHRMLDVKLGEEVLYVGDHIYGDIVKSKRSVGWRTMLVAPELDVELSMKVPSQKVNEELRLLRDQRDKVEDEIHRYEWALRNEASTSGSDGKGDEGVPTKSASPSLALDPVAYGKNLGLLEGLKEQRASLKDRHSRLLANLHQEFHPVWGQLLKTGHQNSRFAHQIERFACLYTSHVSNLAYYSPDKSYRGRMDYMAHEEYDNDFKDDVDGGGDNI